MFDTKTMVTIFEVPLPGRQNKYCINSDCNIKIMSYKVYNNFVNYMIGLPEVCLFLVRFVFGTKNGRKRLPYFGALCN